MPQVATLREGVSLTRILFDKGTLFHLYIGRWTGNKKMHESDLLLDGEVDKNVFYIGHKKLMPPEAHERLQRIEGQARAVLSARSIPFPIGNARYVSYQVLSDVVQQLQRFRDQWDDAIDYLVSNYPRFMEEQLQRLDQQAHQLAEAELEKLKTELKPGKREKLREWEQEQRRLNRSLYPPVSELPNRFVFQWHMFKVSPLEGVEEMSTLDAESLSREQENLRQEMQRWVREASVVMHRELGEAAAQAKRLLDDNGKLNPRNLKPLFDAFETFQAVNFAGPSEFQRTIDQIRARYLQRTGAGETDWRLTAEVVNGSAAEMQGLLNSIATLAINEMAEQAGVRSVRAGEFGRLIDQ